MPRSALPYPTPYLTLNYRAPSYCSLPCRALLYPTLKSPILPDLTIPHPTLPYNTLPYPLPYNTLPYPTLIYTLYYALPYHTLSNRTLPCPTVLSRALLPNLRPTRASFLLSDQERLRFSRAFADNAFKRGLNDAEKGYVSPAFKHGFALIQVPTTYTCSTKYGV